MVLSCLFLDIYPHSAEPLNPFLIAITFFFLSLLLPVLACLLGWITRAKSTDRPAAHHVMEDPIYNICMEYNAQLLRASQRHVSKQASWDLCI